MTASRRKASQVTGSPNAKNPVGLVKGYIARINAGDPAGLATVAGTDPRFIDATGTEFKLTSEAWARFFEDFPDYRVRVEEILSEGESVAVFGTASGSFRAKGNTVPGAAWSFPAAWKAIVRDGKLIEWRIYGDIEAMMRSAGRARSG